MRNIATITQKFADILGDEAAGRVVVAAEHSSILTRSEWIALQELKAQLDDILDYTAEGPPLGAQTGINYDTLEVPS